MTDARTPSDHHQDAQDALAEDRSLRPPNATRYRRDFHGHETEEEARDRSAAEDYEESGGLLAEGLANERRARPWKWAASDDEPAGVDRRCFGRGEADNPSGGSAA